MGSYRGGWCLWVVTGEGGVCGCYRGGWYLWVITGEGGTCG